MIKNPISYPGNKNRLIEQIIPLFPNDVNKIVDVFCGSGVVGLNSPYKHVILNDNCSEILDIIKYFKNNSFEKIVADIEEIIQKYCLTYSRIKPKGYYTEYKHEGLSLYNKNGFNKLKDDYNKVRNIDMLVVLLIYGFNHYLRFNSNHDFNVPVGKVDFSKSIYLTLESFIEGIRDKCLIYINNDYKNKDLYAFEDAVYYFDPPYLITTAPYNSYWKEKDEYELLQLLDELNEQGKKFMLSNVLLSNGKENVILKEWSKKYNVHLMKRQYRNANYQKKNITDSIEVVITNF